MPAEFGEQYMRSLQQRYQTARTTLPRLSDEEFGRVKRNAAGSDIGVESFLMDFAIGAETRRRALDRWASSKSVVPASAEHVAHIINALPSYTIAGEEAIAGMRVEPERSYRVDIVVEDILTEITRRLPRRVDAYRYHQDYAHDAIQVPGLGEINVTLTQTGNGVFSTVSRVESDIFSVWNCRQSGVKYRDTYNDISRPTDIKIRHTEREGRLIRREITHETEINLYGDQDGIYLTKDGRRYTNLRWKTAEGRGYDSDYQRDDLHRTYTGSNPDDPSHKEDNKGWREDGTRLSWQAEEEQAILFLAENVLKPLREAPLPENQATTPPDEEPFPSDKIGPLYTFMGVQDMRKIALIKDHPERAYPEERKAKGVGRRLLPWTMPLGGAPKEAYNGFIWCGVGEVDHEMDMDKVTIGHDYRKTDRLFGDNEGLAVIKPRTATDIYVVDWQEWDDYRERTFTPTHDRLTDQEYVEMHQVVARTLIPVTEYQGNYRNPVVLIGRDLELDEVEVLILPREER